jgi:hypothetical protein
LLVWLARAQEFEAFAMAQSNLLRKVFDDLDADKSGTIDVDEVRGSLQRLGMKYDDGAVTKLIKRIDVDGNGKIDFDEWQVGSIVIRRLHWTLTNPNHNHNTDTLPCVCRFHVARVCVTFDHIRRSCFWCHRPPWTRSSTIGRMR